MPVATRIGSVFLRARSVNALNGTYEPPRISDYGSIVENTFARAQIPEICIPDPNPSQNKQGDFRVCELDKFCEYSCPS